MLVCTTTLVTTLTTGVLVQVTSCLQTLSLAITLLTVGQQRPMPQ